ncbi:MAG: A24 family peptidase [Gemmatimonadales bacterium]
MTNLVPVTLTTLLLLACWFDLRERRIPNALTLAGAMAALLLRSAWGWGSVLEGAAGAGLAVVATLVPFALGFLGGGDVKLLGAVGAFMGTDRLFGALLFVAVAGGLLAVFEAMRRRAMGRVLVNTYGFARRWVLFGRAGVTPTLESPEVMSVPYGVAIAVGSLLWWFFGGGSV